MATFYLFRHGKTELNQQKRLQGHLDSPLTAAGVSDAHTIARKLADIRIDALYSSDLGRAFMTAYLVAQDLGYTKSILITKELREVSFGDLAGMGIAETEAQYPGLQWQTTFVPPNGESLGSMQQRVMSYLFGLAAKHESGSIAIATHGSVLNAVYAAYAGIDLGPYNGQHYDPHDFVAQVTIEKSGVASFAEYGAPSKPPKGAVVNRHSYAL